MKKYIKYTALAALLGLFSGCSDNFFESESGDNITSGQMDNVDPAAGLNGMYAYLYKFDTMGYGDEAQHYDYGFHHLVLASDLWGQDMVQYSSAYGWYYTDYQFGRGSRGYEYIETFYYWNFFYQLIKSANDVLLTATDEAKKEDRGQALAMRAFAYLYLVQMYQHTYAGHQDSPAVPIVLETTSQEDAANNPRATVSAVYEQIEKDLLEAYTDLANYQRDNITTIDRSVVSGLLARMYLLKEDWNNAVKYAREARASYGNPETKEELIDEGYKDMTKHHSWMFASHLTTDAECVQTSIVNFISHISSTAYGYATAGGMFKNISSELYNKIPVNDIRRGWFADEDFTYVGGPNGSVALPKYANLKYMWVDLEGNNTNDLCYMRAEEMWLIEAEALAMGGDISGAKSLLEQFVKTRQADYVCNATDAQSIQNECWLQRRIEFWGEGMSWFDLKRLKKPIVRIYEGTNHNTDAQYDFPAEDDIFRILIPRKEIQDNNGISETDNNPMPAI